MTSQCPSNEEKGFLDKMRPSSNVVTPLLTDLYQLTMAYAYWKSGRHNIDATFDLFYRKAPFDGSFVVFAGLEECIRFIASFRFEPDHIKHISGLLPNCDPSFLSWLESLDCRQVRVFAHREGSVAYPNVPLMKVSGPLAVVQLLETTLLNLVNYASLVATNAHRFRLAAGPQAVLLEFGLRRAQGPDGALTASKYCYLGGFDASSNVAAGFKFGIPTKGTHAHSFVQSYQGIEDVLHMDTFLRKPDGDDIALQTFVRRVLDVRRVLSLDQSTSEGELAAFIAFASAYPSSFSALVDTYSTLDSGVPNFMCVALVLSEYGYSPLGIRIDSGDLVQLSIYAQKLCESIAQQYERLCSPETDHHKHLLKNLSIMVSNDITVEFLNNVSSQEHKISAFGIGTHLVTCRENPALGCVFKLSSIVDTPRMKFSEDVHKASIPGDKEAFRLYNADDILICDVLTLVSERPPVAGKICTFRTRSQPSEVVNVVPGRVEKLFHPAWQGRVMIDIIPPLQYLNSARETLKSHSSSIPTQHDARLLLSEKLSETVEGVWQSEFQGGNEAEGHKE